LNGLSPIRLDINASRYPSVVNPSNKRVAPVSELKTATEADKKKQYNNIEFENGSDPKRNQSNTRQHLLLSDGKYYRANLLSEIVNKMSGLDIPTSRGQYVEYYA
jgi:hypothetical protein